MNNKRKKLKKNTKYYKRINNDIKENKTNKILNLYTKNMYKTKKIITLKVPLNSIKINNSSFYKKYIKLINKYKKRIKKKSKELLRKEKYSNNFYKTKYKLELIIKKLKITIKYFIKNIGNIKISDNNIINDFYELKINNILINKETLYLKNNEIIKIE